MRTQTDPYPQTPANTRGGFILIVVSSILAALVLVAGGLHALLINDIQRVGWMKDGIRALHDADAGAHYVMRSLIEDERSGAIALNQDTTPVNYAAPAGFAFETVTNVTRLADRRAFMFTVVGRAVDARALVEVTFARAASMYGLFGDTDVDMGPNVHVSSYRSSQTTSPVTSTDEETVASNGDIASKGDAVSGTVYLGEDAAGVPGTYTQRGATPGTVVDVPRIDPDPLGAIGGALANRFAQLALTNDNAMATGGVISGNTLEISGNVMLTAGDYYVSEIDLGNHETLVVNGAAGPVRIFLTGPVSIAVNASIVTAPPVPANLQIFYAGNVDLRFPPKNALTGFIYAPYAHVKIMPNGDFRGAVWGGSIELKPSGNMWVDMDFVETFDMDEDLLMTSWRQI